MNESNRISFQYIKWLLHTISINFEIVRGTHMKKNLDELKKEAVATFVNPNAGRRKIPTFNDATEAIEHYKSKSNDLSLCKRQRQRYQKIFNFAAQPGRTLTEIYEKIEDERKQERLSVKQRREKKEEKRYQLGKLIEAALCIDSRYCFKKKVRDSYLDTRFSFFSVHLS